MSSSPLPDHYKVLGVAKDAQEKDIRTAYRKLVLKCHPDKVQDPTLKAQKQEEFQKVQQAYELLTDEDERRKYDDQVKLADLREQLRKTAVSSPPRSASKTRFSTFEVRTADPHRASSYKTSPGVPPSASKSYAQSRSYEDDLPYSHRVYQTSSSRTRRGDTTYVDSRSKRDSERERDREREREQREREQREREQREREQRERERERERERDKDSKERERRKKAEKEEAVRRAERDAKDARREKKTKDKKDDKKKHAKSATVYDESDDTISPIPKSDKKKSSKKYDDKQRDRDRSSHRDAIPIVSPPLVASYPDYATSKYEPVRAAPVAPEQSSSWEDTHAKAASYINMTRAKEGNLQNGLKRSSTYSHHMNQPPAVPTPPPAPNQTSAFPIPEEDDARRSSAAAARPRRGSTESNRAKYRKSSREPVADSVPMGSPRHASHPTMSGSPPHLSRTNTMPADPNSYARAVPITRSKTYNYGEGFEARGRNRSRYTAQINEEDDSDDHHYARDRRNRTGRRDQSMDQGYTETSRYAGYEGGRQPSYSRRAEPEQDRYAYYSGHSDSRPSMPTRESGYSTSAGSAHFAKVKTNKNYSYEDAHYTNYQPPKSREEYSTYA